MKIKNYLVFLNLLVLSFTAAASSNIELIVPHPPGGPVDIVTRAIQQEINKKTDITTVVVNRPGAEGVLAGQYFLSNPGNKIFMAATGSSLFLKLTNPNTPFDPINAYQLVGPVATASTVLVVSEKFGITNLDDFIKESRKRNLNCGTSNSMATFFGNYFANDRSLKITLVPYKGSAMVLADLLGGHIDCAIDVAPVYVNRSDMRVIGVSTTDLSNNFNAPVLSRSSYKFENFYAMGFGQEMDIRTKAKIINVVSNLYQDPEFVKAMAARGIVVNRQVNTNFNSKLNQDFAYLQELDRRLQIQKK